MTFKLYRNLYGSETPLSQYFMISCESREKLSCNNIKYIAVWCTLPHDLLNIKFYVKKHLHSVLKDSLQISVSAVLPKIRIFRTFS